MSSLMKVEAGSKGRSKVARKRAAQRAGSFRIIVAGAATLNLDQRLTISRATVGRTIKDDWDAVTRDFSRNVARVKRELEKA